jgi:murein DD-endopeptidase MepM/ murein hydrolase activator NlpD
LEATIRSRPFLSVMLASVLLAGALIAAPANADTASELQAAEAQVADAQAELDRLNGLWQEAEASLARSQDQEADARARIAELERELARIRVELNERAASLFIAGGNPQIVAVLVSDSITDAADRLEFASALAQTDADLANRVAVQTQDLTWQRQRLADAVAEQARAVSALESQQAAIDARLGDYQQLVDDLEAKLEAEREAAAAAAAAADSASGGGSGSPTSTGSPSGGGGGGAPITGSGWLLTCPVAGASSFVDSFGDPRPGGRSHEGIDLIAARGTPVVAVHGGTVHRTSSSIGGYGVVLTHDGSSDWTFYTHFDSYGAYGEGAHVSAGQVIGYVGNTGTTVYHLHFEYHPGGGSALNPYSALLGVC